MNSSMSNFVDDQSCTRCVIALVNAAYGSGLLIKDALCAFECRVPSRQPKEFQVQFADSRVDQCEWLRAVGAYCDGRAVQLPCCFTDGFKGIHQSLSRV